MQIVNMTSKIENFKIHIKKNKLKESFKKEEKNE